MERAYAGVLGFLAFAVSMARGLLDGQAASATLGQACLALAAFAALGAVAGAIGEAAVAESVERHLQAEIEAHQRQTAQDD